MTPDSKDIYKAALVVIGNEILSGRTQDTNTAWIAEQLVPQGVVLTEVRIVQDIESDIVEAVNALRAKSDYVFTTGGIGPTHDDITAQSLAKAFGVDLALHEKAYQILAEYYEGEDNVTAARRKMAMLPKGAKLIPNPVSGAPGFCFENVYAMAGVPRVMRAMFDDVKAMISCGKPVLSRTVTCSLQGKPRGRCAFAPAGKISASFHRQLSALSRRRARPERGFALDGGRKPRPGDGRGRRYHQGAWRENQCHEHYVR